MSKNKDVDDLRIAGEGSPISLDKTIRSLEKTGSIKTWNILVNNTGIGIAKDDPGVMVIDQESILMQTKWYVEEFHRKKYAGRIPVYIFRYMLYMFWDKDRHDWENQYKPPTIEYVAQITDPEDERYKLVKNLLDWIETNKEATQVLGILTLVYDSLKMAKAQDKSVRFYIDEPETHLHVKRQARLMSMLYSIREEILGDDGIDK